PQMKFTAAGSASFNFQFILGGTYKNADTPGIAVYLQKVRINTYDIDGNGGTNTNQYNEFSGFDTSELGSPTNIVPTYNATLGVTKFRSNTNANTSAVVADPTRVRLTYNNMSSFQLVVGADAGGAIGSTAALA